MFGQLLDDKNQTTQNRKMRQNERERGGLYTRRQTEPTNRGEWNLLKYPYNPLKESERYLPLSLKR
jgi:hypothetical protein